MGLNIRQIMNTYNVHVSHFHLNGLIIIVNYIIVMFHRNSVSYR